MRSEQLILQQEQQVNSLPVKAILMLVSTLTAIAGSTIAPSLPAMQEHFATVPHADYLVRLVLTLPALAIALSAPIVGLLIDNFGRKPILVTALVIYGIAGSAGFFLPTLEQILASRLILGIGVAGTMTTATTLIADYYRDVSRAQFLGLQAACIGFAGVLGVSLGGFLANVNWRFPFALHLFALALLPCVLLILPNVQRSHASQEIATESLSQPLPIKLLIVTYVIALISRIVFYIVPVQLPFYLKQLFNASPAQSGLMLASATLFAASSALLYRRCQSLFKFAAIYGLTFGCAAVGYTLISWGANYFVILAGLAIAGSGFGLLVPNLNFHLVSVTSDAVRGRILSGITTTFFLGQFLSPLISQPISRMVGLSDTYSLAAGFMAALAIGAIVCSSRSPWLKGFL